MAANPDPSTKHYFTMVCTPISMYPTTHRLTLHLGIPPYKPPHILCPTPKSVICVPDELCKSYTAAHQLCSAIGFPASCINIRELPELTNPPLVYQPTAGLLWHFLEPGTLYLSRPQWCSHNFSAPSTMEVIARQHGIPPLSAPNWRSILPWVTLSYSCGMKFTTYQASGSSWLASYHRRNSAPTSSTITCGVGSTRTSSVRRPWGHEIWLDPPSSPPIHCGVVYDARYCLHVKYKPGGSVNSHLDPPSRHPPAGVCRPTSPCW